MKRIIIVCLLCMLLFACVPTPETEFIVNKADGELESIIEDTQPVEQYEIQTDVQPQGEARTLRSILGAPETVQDEFTTKVYGGALDVAVDATVDVPEVSAVPVFAAEIGWGGMHDRTAIAHALLGDEIESITYNRLTYVHNQYVVAYYTQWLSELNEGRYRTVADPEGERYTVENNLAAAHESGRRYADAPEPVPWDGTFGNNGTHTLLWHDPYVLEFYESDGVFQFMQYADLSNPNPGMIAFGRAPKDADAAAITAAKTFLLGVTDLDAEPFAVESTNEGTVIALSLYRAGIPIHPLVYDNGDDMGYDAVHGDAYVRNLHPEYAQIYVVNGEVKAFQWESTLAVTGTENENITLLAFSEIMAQFKAHIRTTYYLNYDERDGSEMHAKLHITAIRLSYLRVNRQNSEGYYLLPVWDFCGWRELIDWSDDPISNQQVNENAEALDWNSSFITINAIDGSIINRDLGY